MDMDAAPGGGVKGTSGTIKEEEAKKAAAILVNLDEIQRKLVELENLKEKGGNIKEDSL